MSNGVLGLYPLLKLINWIKDTEFKIINKKIEGKNIIHILEGEMGFQDLKMDHKHRMYLSFIFAPFSHLKL